MSDARIEFVRLTDVPLAEVLALLNEPRNHRHLPLSGAFTLESAAGWADAKDAQFDQHGYGPWGILVDEAFVGWGGFQREESGADFALVLRPQFWGSGLAITVAALDRGFTDLGLGAVVIALPRSRNPTRVVARLGFEPDGEVEYGGVLFLQFRLTRAAWVRTRSGRHPAKLVTGGVPDQDADRASTGFAAGLTPQ